MTWFGSIFRREKKPVQEGLSPEVVAIFEKLYQYLQDENAQNDSLPERLQSIIKNAVPCDQISGAMGDFGRDFRNPIPVNGRLGELIYLSNLLTPSGQHLLFHRLGSFNALDVYEAVSIDAMVWDILILDFYHPRKSRITPRGYRMASGKKRNHLFSGSNIFVRNFPTNLQEAVCDTHRTCLGLDLAPLDIRLAVERTVFERPPEHARRVDEIRKLVPSAERQV
jgi:hypothetical protein